MPELLLRAALPAVFAVPLVWVILSLLGRSSVRVWLTLPGVLLQLAASIGLWWQVRATGPRYYIPGDWPVPLGVVLRVDGLAVLFIMLTTVVAGACALHAHLYLRGKPAELRRFFWPLLWFLWAGLNGLWLSADLFNIYIGLEMVGLCAVGLVAITGDAQGLSSALRYLFAALAGSLAYLLGVALIYGGYGTLALPDLALQVQPGVSLAVALALLTVGLMFKAALFPLHGWLPPAHGGALAPVSALLSALVIKAPFYVLARLWLDLDLRLGNIGLANTLGLFGAIAVFWGSWKALRQKQLKMVVAYSTVAQIGYFFLLFPLITGVAEGAAVLARDAIMLLVVAHGLAKAALFLAAGNLIAMLGRDTVDDMAGISRFRPLSLFSFGLAGVTLMGLPPSGGFTAKWLLLQSALASGSWIWAMVVILGGLASAAYIFRIFQKSFWQGPDEDTFYHPSLWLVAAPMFLALASVLLGLLAQEPLRLLSQTLQGGSGP